MKNTAESLHVCEVLTIKSINSCEDEGGTHESVKIMIIMRFFIKLDDKMNNKG